MTSIQIIDGGSVTSPRGFVAGATFVGLKSAGPGKLDLALLAGQAPCVAAGVFTTNRLKAAPVQLCEHRLSGSSDAQAVIVNSGIANAGTGEQGLALAEQMAGLAAARLGISPSRVLVASTGKIGHHVPLDKIRAGLSAITVSEQGGHEAARAIMTTDTRPKEIAVSCRLGRTGAATSVTVAGMAKGAGMIHPQMATLLAFITTDAAVDPGYLRRRAAACCGP